MDNWLSQFIIAYGLWGVFLLLFIENIFPVLPSELVIPVAGATGAMIGLPLWEVLTAASVGAMVGQMPWYWSAKWLGYDRFRRFAARFGRFTTIGPLEIDRASAWFARHGEKAVFLGRVTPVVRGVISIPAGLTNMPLGRFLAWSIPGSTLWIILLGWAGYLLGKRAPEIAEYADPVTKGILILVVIVWLYRVVTWKQREQGMGA